MSVVLLQSKIFIGKKGDIAQLPSYSEGPFSDCRTEHIHGSCVSTSVYVCGQERELLILPAPGAPDRNMDKQLMDSRLPVDNKEEQSIDLKRHKWKFPITTNVRATNC